MSKKENRPLVIIHFQPLERYPPIMNLLNYLSKNAIGKFIVISTVNSYENIFQPYKNLSEKIKIIRATAIVAASPFRIYNYAFFYLKSLFILIKNKPKSVLYFETISSWPALIYKKLRGNNVKLFAHYHEYTSSQEYLHNMRLVKQMYKMEIKMYHSKYSWISHTNEMRLQEFIDDNHLEKVNKPIFHVMPNYPSQQWAKGKTNFNASSKLRLVYVGSIGYDSMYLKEIIEWVLQNKSILSLDFYSNNLDDKANIFLQTIKDDCITFHGGCNYEDLPVILKDYDVGLVIYKPISENWIYNAPNKVFEYLACGLDVWFSETMTYTLSLSREKVYPKIIPVDFENLKDFNFKEKLHRENIEYSATSFYYENVYGEIYNCLNAL